MQQQDGGDRQSRGEAVADGTLFGAQHSPQQDRDDDDGENRAQRIGIAENCIVHPEIAERGNPGHAFTGAQQAAEESRLAVEHGDPGPGRAVHEQQTQAGALEQRNLHAHRGLGRYDRGQNAESGGQMECGHRAPMSVAGPFNHAHQGPKHQQHPAPPRTHRRQRHVNPRPEKSQHHRRKENDFVVPHYDQQHLQAQECPEVKRTGEIAGVGLGERKESNHAERHDQQGQQFGIVPHERASKTEWTAPAAPSAQTEGV